MENGKSPGGKSRRNDDSDRRKTVSGAIPDIQPRKNGTVAPIDPMRFPWSSPSAPTSPTHPDPPRVTPSSKTSAHKRNTSGNIFSRLNFLRGSGDDGKTASKEKEPTSPTKSLFSRKSVDEDASPVSPEKEGGALAAALKQSKTRKRKGSLRKTALLGGKRNISENRERKGSFSLLQRPSSAKQAQQLPVREQEVEIANGGATAFGDEDEAAIHRTSQDTSPHRNFSYDNALASSSSESGWSADPPAVSDARLSLLTDLQPPSTRKVVNDLGSPVDAKSPTTASQTSTTDDESTDLLTFSHPITKTYTSQTSGGSSVASSPPQSYFPSPHPHLHQNQSRRSTSTRSPLSRTLPQSAYPSLPHPTSSPEPHPYTETESWGWILLFTTWLTFTVGMGSCLEIWSWAWDVGETPYAPPELEDDPTLPIVGYYPALMVLTGVVAWVWISVAWVGMKYFRHAKIEV